MLEPQEIQCSRTMWKIRWTKRRTIENILQIEKKLTLANKYY